MAPDIAKLGLIAGHGRFPFLVLEEAARRRIPVVVAAIREEALPEIDGFARCLESDFSSPIQVVWLGLGQLGKLLRTFAEHGVDKAVMAGKVRHVQIFAPGAGPDSRTLRRTLPDWKMLRLLLSLPRKNTESLIGAISRTLADNGVELMDSTFLLSRLLPKPGVLTGRPPDSEEARDIEYGRRIAQEIARLDIGQTVVVKSQTVVAVEAMEGTDETIRRAARLVDGQRLTVVKVSRPRQDMRFDVPVIGLDTLEVLKECHATALSIDAGRTLMLDYDRFLEEADRSGIAVLAGEP
jgi:DUF1009 family protein